MDAELLLSVMKVIMIIGRDRDTIVKEIILNLSGSFDDDDSSDDRSDNAMIMNITTMRVT